MVMIPTPRIVVKIKIHWYENEVFRNQTLPFLDIILVTVIILFLG
jgi:hypothetical protein